MRLCGNFYQSVTDGIIYPGCDKINTQIVGSYKHKVQEKFTHEVEKERKT